MVVLIYEASKGKWNQYMCIKLRSQEQDGRDAHIMLKNQLLSFNSVTVFSLPLGPTGVLPGSNWCFSLLRS